MAEKISAFEFSNSDTAGNLDLQRQGYADGISDMYTSAPSVIDVPTSMR